MSADREFEKVAMFKKTFQCCYPKIALKDVKKKKRKSQR